MTGHQDKPLVNVEFPEGEVLGHVGMQRQIRSRDKIDCLLACGFKSGTRGG